MEDGITRTIGCDLGDRVSEVCVLDAEGLVVANRRFRSTKKGFADVFTKLSPSRVIIEVGGHSPWVSRLLASLGHSVIVANPRKVALISKNAHKSDRTDAELLARLGRVDPLLLSPIQHRGQAMQWVRTLLRARAQLVDIRTQLVNTVRALVKSYDGLRLPSCSTATFHLKVAQDIDLELRPILCPMLSTIESASTQIKRLDAQIAQCNQEMAETQCLQQVGGVGPVTALAFVATLDDPSRFRRSRQVGAFLGLCPRRAQSGERDRQLGISKSGDPYVRKLLVQCSHRILGPFGPDCDLRRWGLAMAERGGKSAKKRAVVAVARKLAVLLHALWVSNAIYIPLGHSRRHQQAA